MKVNFKKDFIDCFGEQVKETIPAPTPENPQGTKEAVVTVWELMARHLFNLSALGGVAVKPDIKYKAYRLSCRIAKNPSEVELSTEEAVFIKEIANEHLSAGAYGYLVDIIEGK